VMGPGARIEEPRHVLVIEDEPQMRSMLVDNLEFEGYRVTAVSSGEEALQTCANHQFALLLVDVMLPGISGFDVCQQVRARGMHVPIVVLTARTHERDRVRGLDLGADDYVNKPFSVRELLARIAAILRRSRGSESDTSVYDDGQLRIDGRTLRVYVEGEEVKLAKKELELLWMLVRNRPAVVSRDRILSEVWQVAEDVETRTVDAHIRNLRKKIGKDRIQTVIGYGYRFEA
jgi:two-component system, OmpR family, alkaline phosphatase synthesis response regulator PhoP